LSFNNAVRGVIAAEDFKRTAASAAATRNVDGPEPSNAANCGSNEARAAVLSRSARGLKFPVMRSRAAGLPQVASA
jgi:hypothetical protein